MKTRSQLDKYYQKKYGVGLDWYEAQEIIQDGKCGICGRPPVKNRLAVDHDHKFKYLQVQTNQGSAGTWMARIKELDLWVYGKKSKNAAIQAVRAIAKTRSVRGLLCFRCNSGLQKFSDDSVRLHNAGLYLEKFKETLNVKS